VKVNSFREVFRFSNSLKTQSEGDGYSNGGGDSLSQGGKRQPQPQPQDEAKGVLSSPVLTPEQELAAVQSALHDFKTEAQAQNHGLQATIRGPGLTVVLSDIHGSVIRTFSPDEFLRLRSSGGQDNRGRGRLLDQKL